MWLRGVRRLARRSGISGCERRPLAFADSSASAKARLLPGQDLATLAGTRRRRDQEFGLRPALQRPGERRLPVATQGDHGRRRRGVGVPGDVRRWTHRSTDRGAIPDGAGCRIRGSYARGGAGRVDGRNRATGAPAARHHGTRPFWSRWTQNCGGGDGQAEDPQDRPRNTSEGPQEANVDHAARRACRPHCERLAHQTLHRSESALCVRRRSRGSRQLRHVRGRLHARGRSLHVRNAAPALRARARRRATRTRAIAARSKRCSSASGSSKTARSAPSPRWCTTWT